MATEFDVFYCISARDYGQRLNQDLPHNIQMQSVSIAVHFEPHNHQHSSKRAPDVERTRRQTSWVVAKTRTYGYYFIAGAGARFSKVPLTFRVRNQIFKSKYKE